MSGGKHTPGPWNVQPDSDLFAKIGSQANGGIYVAKIQGPDTAANARLIAASPTMAEYIQRKADAGDHEASAIMEAIHATR